MKKKLILLTGMILVLLSLASCMQSEQQAGKLIYGAECIILRCPDSTFYAIEKPGANEEKVWEGLDLPLREKWVKMTTKEVAGRILEGELQEYEFLDARISMRVSRESEALCIDDLWDDVRISPEEVHALGLLDETRCTEIAEYRSMVPESEQ